MSRFYLWLLAFVMVPIAAVEWKESDFISAFFCLSLAVALSVCLIMMRRQEALGVKHPSARNGNNALFQ